MISINDVRWRIEIIPPSHPILMYKTNIPAFGCCDDVTKTIYLNQSLTPSQMKNVLCHEMVHAAMYSYNIDLDDNVEEIVADIIMSYGDEIIKTTKLAIKQEKGLIGRQSN